MAAKTAGSVNARWRRLAPAPIVASVSTRANTTMRGAPPSAPRVCRHSRNDALATHDGGRRGDVGAAAGAIVNRGALTAAVNKRIAFALGGRARARAALTARRGDAPAPWQRPRAT